MAEKGISGRWGDNLWSFIVGAGSLPPAPGVFGERAIAPDGTVYEIQVLPGQGYTVLFLEHTSPDGTWTFEQTGPDLVTAEGVAYHQYDLRLLDGAILTDHAQAVVR